MASRVRRGAPSKLLEGSQLTAISAETYFQTRLPKRDRSKRSQEFFEQRLFWHVRCYFLETCSRETTSPWKLDALT